MLLEPVTRDTVNELLSFIKEIAIYEKLLHEVKSTPEILIDSLFDREHPCAKAHFIRNPKNERIGFVVHFYAFSTFSGRPMLYVEDIFIREEHRGHGYGKKVWSELINIAKEKNCSAMVWNVLDWNKPAIDFYLSLGAEPMSEWTMFKLKF